MIVLTKLANKQEIAAYWFAPVTLKHSRPDSNSPQKQDGLDDSAWSTEGGFIGFASGYFIQL